MTLTRRFVVLASPVEFGSVIQQRRLPAQTQPATVTASAPLATPPAASMRPPALAADLVRDYVIAGHGNLERVKTMLAEHSGLINATWDWGGGDFETALGGASHMGRRDIAEFLISQGARVDIFASAMLGNLDAVKSIAEAFPGTAKCLGPTGFHSSNMPERAGWKRRQCFNTWSTMGVNEIVQECRVRLIW